MLNSSPQIYTVDNFLTSEECDHIIEISKDKFQESLVAGNSGGYKSQGRTSQNYWLAHDHDNKTYRIAQKIAELVGYPLSHAEKFQVIYYQPNQEYRKHCDAWKFDQSDKSARCLLKGGQRMLTALAYLNTVPSGGSTRFTKLNIEVSAEKGKILVFHNCHENSNQVHELSEHAGTPVISGEKYAFNLWFREFPVTHKYIHPY